MYRKYLAEYMTETPTTPNSKNPMSWLLPAKPELVEELRGLMQSTRAPLDAQADCALKDPVIALDLLKTANSITIAGSKTVITTLRGAIQRMGNAEVLVRLNEVENREQITTPGVTEWIEVHREHCKKLSSLTGLIADIKQGGYTEECRIASLFTFLGDMLAAAFLREDYVLLAHNCTRKILNYRLAQKFHFDPEQTVIRYLQRHGVPELLIFPLDRKASTKDPRGAVMRPICTAAYELYDAFLGGKREKYKVQAKLPSSSLVKVLQLTEPQYKRMIEGIEGILGPEPEI